MVYNIYYNIYSILLIIYSILLHNLGKRSRTTSSSTENTAKVSHNQTNANKSIQTPIQLIKSNIDKSECAIIKDNDKENEIISKNKLKKCKVEEFSICCEVNENNEKITKKINVKKGKKQNEDVEKQDVGIVKRNKAIVTQSLKKENNIKSTKEIVENNESEISMNLKKDLTSKSNEDIEQLTSTNELKDNDITMTKRHLPEIKNILKENNSENENKEIIIIDDINNVLISKTGCSSDNKINSKVGVNGIYKDNEDSNDISNDKLKIKITDIFGISLSMERKDSIGLIKPTKKKRNDKSRSERNNKSHKKQHHSSGNLKNIIQSEITSSSETEAKTCNTDALEQKTPKIKQKKHYVIDHSATIIANNETEQPSISSKDNVYISDKIQNHISSAEISVAKAQTENRNLAKQVVIDNAPAIIKQNVSQPPTELKTDKVDASSIENTTTVELETPAATRRRTFQRKAHTGEMSYSIQTTIESVIDDITQEIIKGDCSFDNDADTRQLSPILRSNSRTKDARSETSLSRNTDTDRSFETDASTNLNSDNCDVNNSYDLNSGYQLNEVKTTSNSLEEIVFQDMNG